MANRALIIGCQTGSLKGTVNDVNTMMKILEARRFAIQRLDQLQATRVAILDGYQRLIADTQEGDAAVLYYSGHGGRSRNPDSSRGPTYYQFIVPVDIYDSRQDDFRGIMSHELSALLSRLTAKTKNVTVILDCCHSAMMSRGEERLRVKALPREWILGIESHLELLRRQGIDVSGMPRGNPDAVGVMACGASESAYEYTPAGGATIGLLTESLHAVFAESSSTNIDWRTVGIRVRERIVTQFPTQRPNIEGPSSRVVFQTVEGERTGVVPLVLRGEEATIEAGHLLGVRIDDEYAVMPPGSAKLDPKERIALAKVVRVGGGASQVLLTSEPHRRAAETGDLAFPVRAGFVRGAVRVVGVSTGADAMRAAIAANSFLTVCEEPGGEAFAVVRVTDGFVELRDTTEVLLWPRKPSDAAGIQETLHNLRVLSQARAMRLLESGEGEAALNANVELSWGVVVDGQLRELAHTGETVHCGERVAISVINRADAPCWLAVFDVGLAGKLTLLNGRSAAEGIELAKGNPWRFGLDKTGQLTGDELKWPQGLPQDAPRPESLVVIVMDGPCDLRPLETAGMRAIEERKGKGSNLQRIFDQMLTARTRDLGQEEPSAVLSYAVRHIDFFVDPTPAPGMRSAIRPFLIDEMPHPSVLRFAPREFAEEAPRKIGISLTELRIHDNRGWGKVTVRVDTMVVTKATVTKEPRLWQQTFRFPRIGDEEALPFGKQILYCGDVEDFVTLGIWVSRDTEGSKDLAEMFAAELNSQRFKLAAGTIAALAVAAPQAAIAVAAVGAGATLLELGYNLLSAALPKSIGLYRNAFLRSDRFGVGQHPSSGLLRAQDFSLSYTITDEGGETGSRPPPEKAAPTGDALIMLQDAKRKYANQKFEGGEHLWLGLRGLFAACTEAGIDRTPYMYIQRHDRSERFNYGELVALSGDLYETPEELFEERPGPQPWLYESNDLSDLKRVFARELYWIEGERRNEHVGYPDETIALVWNAKSYLELAKRNTPHFGWHNMLAYCRYHEEALKYALAADPRDDGDPQWRRALFFNAFADHFLTDAFAAGHVRVPREQIRLWGQDQGYSSSLSGMLSKLLHDQDGHVASFHGQGEGLLSASEGLRVLNSRGVEWYTRCDGQLFIVKPDQSDPLLAEPSSAVKESVLELFRARLEKKRPDGLFRATAYVPFPHPVLAPMTEKFPANVQDARIGDLLGSVRWYLKIPGTSGRMEPQHVTALFSALPRIMGAMRDAVAKDVTDKPELTSRLPQSYIEAFKRIS